MEEAITAVPQDSTSSDAMAAFGPNEWLVDELYQQYLQDKSSVDRAWGEFFADYPPGDSSPGRAPQSPAQTDGSDHRPEQRHERQANVAPAPAKPVEGAPGQRAAPP